LTVPTPPRVPGFVPEPSPETAPVQRYRIGMYGGGIEEIDRYQLRERIRRGEVSAATEIAPAGSDEWRRVSAYPELTRYLELAATQPKVSDAPVTSRTVPAETVASRIVPALLYPIAGGEILVIVGLAILQSLPGISLLVIPVTTVYVLAIIRASSEGKTKMPAWVETDDIPAMFTIWIRTVIVTAISLWPMLVWYGVWYFRAARGPHAQARLVAGLVVTGLISLLYYPACLAMIAVWDSVWASLNPALIVRTIRAMGADYGVAVAAWAAATGLALLVSKPLDALVGWLPIVGQVPGRMLWIWAQFYGAHLLGWAVYRHSVELGWN
jgi:hypothetical protein